LIVLVSVVSAERRKAKLDLKESTQSTLNKNQHVHHHH